MDTSRLEDSELRSTSDKELLVDVAAAFVRHKALFLVVFFGTVLSAYIVGQVRTEFYETTTSVLVKLGRENTEVPATVQKGSVMTAGVRKEQLNAEVQMLSSRGLIEEVVDRLGATAFAFQAPQPQTILQKARYYLKSISRWGKAQIETFLITVNLKKELTDREKVILGIEGALNVKAERDSDAIVVELLYPDSDLAVRVLTTLLQLYLDHHVRVWREVEVKDFFDAQVDSYRQKLHDIEEAKEEIKVKWNLISVDEQRTLLLQQLQKLKNQMQDSELQKATLRAQQASMRAQLKALPDELRQSREIRPNPSIQSIKERLTSLQQEHARLSTLYQTESQRVKNLDREIAELNHFLEEEDSTLVGSITLQANPLKQNFERSLEEVEVQIAGLETSMQQLRVQAATVQEQLERLNTGEYQLTSIERERQVVEQEYLTSVKRRAESIMAEGLDKSRIVNVAVLSPPARAIQPSYPRKLLLVGVSLPIGLLFGAALVLLVEYLSDVIHTQRDLAGIEGFSYLGTFRLRELQSVIALNADHKEAGSGSLDAG